MRRILLGLLIFVVVLVVAAVAVPFVFKDKLRALADQQIAQRVRAKVQYDPANIDVSFLHSFPDLTLDIKELRVIGVDSFSRDTLAYLPDLRVGLDIMSVVRGGEIKINTVELERPDLSIKVLKSGLANWNIVISDSAAAAKGQDTSQVNLAIKGWKITDGHLRYEDLTLPFRMEARQVNHGGQGDFAQNVFDMTSHTAAGSLNMSYGGVAYVTDKQLDADVTLNMDLSKNAVSRSRIISLSSTNSRSASPGAIGLPNVTDITYDITFKALETDFKNAVESGAGRVYTSQIQEH